MGITTTISFIGTSLGVLAIIISLFKQKEIFFKKIAFVLMLFCMTYYCYLDFLIDSGWIMDFPHFFKTGSPVFYLLSIAIFWLGQAHLNQKTRLNRWDYLLLLVPVLNFIEFIPFYALPVSEKLDHLRTLMGDRDQIIYAYEGWLPTYFHYLLQVTFGSGVSIYLLASTIKTKKANKEINFNWLITLSIIFLSFFLGAVLMLLFDNSSFQIHQNASWLFASTILALLVLLFFEPTILYGTHLQVTALPSKRAVVAVEESDAQKYRTLIEDFFLTNDNYLDPDFRQQDLADFLKITKNKLSLLINQVFNQNFNQLVNQKRIEFTIRKLQNKEWINLSLEGIAQEVGFRSRTTFIKAFHENTGMPPSEYRKKVLMN